MAISVNNAWLHGLAVLKLPSTAFSAEEVRSSNDVNARIVKSYNWHWKLTAGTNIAVTAATGQPYTMAAGDQSKFLAPADANLLSGSTEQPKLWYSEGVLPLTSTTGQPVSWCLTSATTIRLWPKPDASYTFQWRYYARPTVFAANSENYDCPDSFEDVIFAGVIWKLMQLLDDDRQKDQYQDFAIKIKEQIESEERTMGGR